MQHSHLLRIESIGVHRIRSEKEAKNINNWSKQQKNRKALIIVFPYGLLKSICVHCFSRNIRSTDVLNLAPKKYKKKKEFIQITWLMFIRLLWNKIYEIRKAVYTTCFLNIQNQFSNHIHTHARDATVSFSSPYFFCFWLFSR